MRPCPRCRAPLQNRDATCPQCGAAEPPAPKPNTDPLPRLSRRERALNFFFDFSDFGLAAVAGIVSLITLLGAIGYLLASAVGASVGVIAAIALLLAVASLGEGG